MIPSLVGKTCLVTEGSIGIGRGISLQLAKAGATVYITGRHKRVLEKFVGEAKERASIPFLRDAKIIPVEINSSNDNEVEKFFQRISDETNGKLDLLVNNAHAKLRMIPNNDLKPFWKKCPFDIWDTVVGVNLRQYYCYASFATKMMVENKQGLIINIQSGSIVRSYFTGNRHSVVHRIGIDGLAKMTSDCAKELQKYNVAVVSLYPGAIDATKMRDAILDDMIFWSRPKVNISGVEDRIAVFKEGASFQYPGIGITHLASDKNVIRKTGKRLLMSDLAREYKFTDIDEVQGVYDDMRSVKSILKISGRPRMAAYVPKFVRVPVSLLNMSKYKF